MATLHEPKANRSVALQRWLGVRRTELDQLVVVHGAVRGRGSGRQWATRQIKQAYVVLLSAHFQGFCRDLHSEGTDHIVRSIHPVALQETLRIELALGRKLDRGNPTPGSIGADFTRLGLSFWGHLRRMDARSEERQSKLVALSDWRNAIAHQDFDRGKLRTAHLDLRTIAGWRRACDGLARSFDRVMRAHIASTTGTAPW